MRGLRKIGLYGLLLSSTVPVAYCGDVAQLHRRLAGIDRQRDGLNTPAPDLEGECLAMLVEHNTPQEQGLIHAQIASVFAQNGLTDPDKTIQYCRKSLEFPLEVHTSGRMYIHWADGLQVNYGHAKKGARAQLRREASIVCLRGLNFILDQNPPQRTQPLPVVNRFEHSGQRDDPGFQELVQENRRQMVQRERVLLENDLVLHRDILVGKIVTLYPGLLAENPELRALVKASIHGDGRTQEVLDLLRAKAGEALPEARKATPDVQDQ